MISCKDFSESACPYVRSGCYQNRCGCHELQHSYNDLKLVFQEDNNVFSIYDFSVNKSMCRAESQVDIIQKAAKTDLIRWEEGFITPVDGYVKIAKDPVVEKLSEILDVMEECERTERKRKRTERREKRQTQVMRRYSYQETLNSMGTTMSPLPGTQSSEYSTDAKSSEEYHSDTDQDGANANRQFSITQSSVQRQLRKYFLLMPNGSSMALKVDPAQTLAPVQLDTKRQSCTNDISMSDLSLPDHSGWMTWQSGGGKRVWCAVVDMILCVCENDQAERPMEVLILPGCNIRPLIYKTAINGLKTRSNTNTITGIGKYQMVIDNCSTRRKHIFSVENQAILNVWVNVLENASNLDPDSINGMTLERRSSLNSMLQEGHNSGCTTPRYIPSSDSSNRVQKVSNCGTVEADKTLSTQNGLGDSQQESQFQGQSLQEFRKRLRGLDTEHEQSKHVPIKAQHFEKAPLKESKPTSSKKIRSFGGSLESLLKFRKKKSKKDLIDTSSMEDEDSMSSGGQTSLQSMEGDTTSYPNPMATPFDIGKYSSTKKLSGKSRSKDTNIIRRASDLKERVITKRDSKSTIRLGDLTDCSMHGHLYCKHLLKWLKHWCAVCHGCFYSFKSQSPEDPPHFAILLNQCTISILSEQERKHKRKFVFKLSRPNSKSLYLSAGDNNELSRWVQVLHMEANNVQSDIVNKENQYITDHTPNDPFTHSIASFRNPLQTTDSCVSGPNYPDQTTQAKDPEKLRQAPVKPPRKLRNSSCPPTSRSTLTTPEPSVISSSEDCETSGSASSIKEDNFALARPSNSLQSPTHDRAVTHVWQNDRGYLFNVIRSKLKAYRKRKEESAIAGLTTNVVENILVIDDDTHVQTDARTETVVKGSRDIRRSRSFSSDRKIMDADAAEKNGSQSGLRKKHKPLTVRKIPVSELGNPSTSGYLERRIFNGQWIRYWYVLFEQTLYSYLTPDDSVTVDVIDLPNYSVTSLVDKFRGKRFVIQLWHEIFSTVYLSADTREIMTEWCEHLVNAMKISDMNPNSSDDVDQIEESTSSGCETTIQNEASDLRQTVKQKLLEEMLRQKYELEKKQADRQRKQKVSGIENNNKTNPNSELTSEEQRMSDVVRLRQRRFSTQIKAITIQKQIQPKKGLFSFGNKKKADESKNIYLKEQLKELTHKLHKIDLDLTQCEKGSTSSDILDCNQNRKYSSRTVFPSDENDVAISEIDPSMHHTNSIKTAMQKWTTRTFSKRKQLKSGKIDEMNGNIFRSRDSISDCNGYDSQDDSLSDNSVIDLTRLSHKSKDSDLKLDLSFTDSKPLQTFRQRSTTSCSSSSSATSPKREVDPSVMAEIEAFEELTKQVLSARSDRSTSK